MKNILLIGIAIATCSPSLLQAQYPTRVNAGALEPGHIIPEITGKTLDGADFNLHRDLKGKIVLLDFWATWCGPCIAETPNIRKNYDKWHDKGFEVVGITLDSKLDDARSYIKKKKLPWFQLGDGKGFRSPYATSFSIKGIPQFILLDRESRVIASNVRGERLGQLLEKHINGNPEESKEASIASTSPEIDALFTTLKNEFKSDSGERSLAALRPLLDLDPGFDGKLQELAYAHRPLDSTSPHAKTVYLMADRVLSRGSTTQDMHRYAGTARAHAALELGGPYVAGMQLNSLARMRQKDTPQYMELETHFAHRTGDADLIISRLHRSALAGTARYDDVSEQLESCKSLRVTKTEELVQLHFWLGSQRDLPNDRASLKRSEGRFTAIYNPRNTHLAGSLALHLVVLLQSGQSIDLPMELDAANLRFTVTSDIPDADGPIRFYFRDSFKRVDSNEGRYWIVTP